MFNTGMFGWRRNIFIYVNSSKQDLTGQSVWCKIKQSLLNFYIDRKPAAVCFCCDQMFLIWPLCCRTQWGIKLKNMSLIPPKFCIYHNKWIQSPDLVRVHLQSSSTPTSWCKSGSIILIKSAAIHMLENTHYFNLWEWWRVFTASALAVIMFGAAGGSEADHYFWSVS